mgnify:FL=1
MTNQYNSGYHEDTLVMMADGTEKAIKDVKKGELIKGYDTYFEPHEEPGFDGASLMLNSMIDGEVKGVGKKEVDELLQINFSHGKKLLVEPSSVMFARPLPCGTVEHEDGTITEGCSSESQNNGIENSVSEYEAHACCNVGWMAVDLESAIEKYGAQLIDVNTFCGIAKGTGVYANEEFIVSDGVLSEDGEEENGARRLFRLQQDRDYTVESWEIVKGSFEVYNFTKVENIELMFANTIVFGTGDIFIGVE